MLEVLRGAVKSPEHHHQRRHRFRKTTLLNVLSSFIPTVSESLPSSSAELQLQQTTLFVETPSEHRGQGWSVSVS